MSDTPKYSTSTLSEQPNVTDKPAATRKPWLRFRGQRHTDFSRVIIRNQIADRCGLKTSETVLLLVIADHCQSDTRHREYRLCWPSKNLLISETGLGIASIKRGIANLARLGLIRRFQVVDDWYFQIADPDDMALNIGAEFAKGGYQNDTGGGINLIPGGVSEVYPPTEVLIEDSAKDVGKPRRAVHWYQEIVRGLPGEWVDVFWRAVEDMQLPEPEPPRSKQDAADWFCEQAGISFEERAAP